MGIFNFGKKSNSKQQPSYIRGVELNDGKYAHLFNTTMIHSERGVNTYTSEIYITENIDDTILVDYTKPIAFQLPADKDNLITPLIQRYYETASGRKLNDMQYTFIGDIKPADNGQLYYYNEGPDNETAKIIEEESIKFANQRKERRRQIEEQKKQAAEAEKGAKTAEAAKAVTVTEAAKATDQARRLAEPYFKYNSGFTQTEGYDLINTKTGNILLLRGMKKYKDTNGRYLYTAYVRSTDEDGYTDFSTPLGYQIAFTTPTRLADIIANQKTPYNRAIAQAIQRMISNSYQTIEKSNPDGLIDIGGISNDGRIIKNNPAYGVSTEIANKIKELGGTQMEEKDRGIGE